jgi:hypothetical protein
MHNVRSAKMHRAGCRVPCRRRSVLRAGWRRRATEPITSSIPNFTEEATAATETPKIEEAASHRDEEPGKERERWMDGGAG